MPNPHNLPTHLMPFLVPLLLTAVCVYIIFTQLLLALSDLTLVVGRQEEHPACKN